MRKVILKKYIFYQKKCIIQETWESFGFKGGDMLKHRYDFLRTLQLATGITISIADTRSGIILAHPDVRLPRMIAYAADQFEENGCDLEHPLLVSDQSLYFFALAGLGSSSYVMLGPVGPVKYGEKLLRRHLEASPYAEETDAVLNLLRYGPNCSVQNVMNTLRLAVHIISGQLVSTDNIRMLSQDFLEANTEENIGGTLVKNQYEAAENGEAHTPWAYEELFQQAIREGNPEVFREYRSRPVPGMIGRMSENDTRQKRYEFVASVTLFCRAAIQGGLDSETAYLISDTFCQEMDLLPPPVDTGRLYISAVNTYISKVREVQGTKKKYSPDIAECCRFIENNVQNHIGLTEIALHCGISKRWISRKFRKETGCTIPEYIQRKKLERARQLLQYTRYSVSEISSILQYSTQSYFTEQFRKRYHMTPKKFREMYGA